MQFPCDGGRYFSKKSDESFLRNQLKLANLGDIEVLHRKKG